MPDRPLAVAAVRVLLEAGADWRITFAHHSRQHDGTPTTQVLSAYWLCHARLAHDEQRGDRKACAEALQRYGADIPCRVLLAAQHGHDGELLRLLGAGESPDAHGGFLQEEAPGLTTPLMAAAAQGHVECVRSLVSANAEVHFTSCIGDKAIDVASRHDRVAKVAVLVAPPLATTGSTDCI